MKNHILLLCLLLFTCTVFAQRDDRDNDGDGSTPQVITPPATPGLEPILSISAGPILDYNAPGSLSLTIAYDNNGPAWSTLSFDLTVSGSQNGFNDFRWTADQLAQALNNSAMFDTNGIQYSFKNIVVTPKNSSSTTTPDDEFEVKVSVTNTIGSVTSVGFPPTFWPPYTRITAELIEGAPPIDPGCGDKWVGVELEYTADELGNIYPGENPEHIIVEGEICGCNQPGYCNTSSDAGFNDGTCTQRCGCMDPDAMNYDETAIYDDGTYCTYKTPQKKSEEINLIQVYPNPTTGILNFEATNEVHSIQLFNSNSKLVYEYKGDVYGQLDISSLPSGIYQLRALLTSGRVNASKVILIK